MKPALFITAITLCAVPALAAGHRVMRFDLPGSGLSAPDATVDYTDDRSLPVLEAPLDQLGVAQASVVGNSIGGRIAWKFAAAFPGWRRAAATRGSHACARPCSKTRCPCFAAAVRPGCCCGASATR